MNLGLPRMKLHLTSSFTTIDCFVPQDTLTFSGFNIYVFCATALAMTRSKTGFESDAFKLHDDAAPVLIRAAI
jgi:hypothetical protein